MKRAQVLRWDAYSPFNQIQILHFKGIRDSNFLSDWPYIVRSSVTATDI